ncbi:MAG: multiheme c-type cytochrome, partial [Betaproteobacteria bacterium]
MSVHRWTAVLLAAAALGLSGCTTNPGSAAADQFVGSDKCSTCHQAEFKSWQATYHSKMVQPAAQGLLKDAVDAWAKDGKGNAGPAKGNIDGKAYALADVQMVVGSKWKQRYLVKNPATGYHQFLDKQWNSYTKLWEGYGQKNDWETQCTTCHVTGYRVTEFDEKTSSIRKASFAEKNIGCEACHGPGGAHAASGKKTDIFNPRNAPKAEADKVCGYCHIRVENYRFKTGQG